MPVRWVAARFTLHTRHIDLDALVGPLVLLWVVNSYRHLLETTICSDLKSRTIVNWDFAAATTDQPTHPNEHLCTVSTVVCTALQLCVMVTAPAWFLMRARPWLAVLTSCSQFVAVFIGLRTQGIQAGIQAGLWGANFPVKGVSVILLSAWSWSLVAQHLSLQHEGVPGLLSIALHALLTPASMLLLPRVYPQISYPWWTLPLMGAGIGIALSLGRQVEPASRAPRRTSISKTAHRISTKTSSGTNSSTSSACEEGKSSIPSHADSQSTFADREASVSSSVSSELEPECDSMVGGVELVCQASLDVINTLRQAAKIKPKYVSKARRYLVRTKVPHMEPSELAPDFLQMLNDSLAQDSAYPCLVLRATMLPGCIQLLVEVVMLERPDADMAAATPSGAAISPVATISSVPAQQALEAAAPTLQGPDPTSWLQCMHLQPPPGVKVVSQACGREWETAWNTDTQDWATLPSKNPQAEQLNAPYIVGATRILLLSEAILPSGPAADNCVCPKSDIEPLPVHSEVLRVAVKHSSDELVLHVSSQGRHLDFEAYLVEGEIVGAHTSKAHISKFEVHLSGAFPRSGLITIECNDGTSSFSNSVPILVTEDIILAGDMTQLLGCQDETDGTSGAATGTNELVLDLGSWLDYMAAMTVKPINQHTLSISEQPAGQSGFNLSAQMEDLLRSAPTRSHMAQIGLSLLTTAIEAGCTHLARTLMQELLSVGHSFTWVTNECTASAQDDASSTTLLHAAVSSGSTSMVDLVMQWGEEGGSPFAWGMPPAEKSSDEKTQVLTPLHLAASLDDKGKLSRHILCKYPAARTLWRTSVSQQGCTPASLAAAAGHVIRDWSNVSAAPLQGRSSTSGSSGSSGSNGAPRGFDSETILESAQEEEVVISQGVVKTVPYSIAAAAVMREDDDYHTWLSRRDILISRQLSLIAICLAGVVTFGLFSKGGGFVYGAAPTTLMMIFHFTRLGLISNASETYVQHRELLNVCWHCARVLLKMLPLLGYYFCCAPPVPYLLCTDWLVEGLLVTLCAQVRPSVTLVCRLVDAYVTSLVYVKYGVAGSTSAAVCAAVGWNMGCVVLCSVVDGYNRHEFHHRPQITVPLPSMDKKKKKVQ